MKKLLGLLSLLLFVSVLTISCGGNAEDAATASNRTR